jgi:hypothetical protein
MQNFSPTSAFKFSANKSSYMNTRPQFYKKDTNKLVERPMIDNPLVSRDAYRIHSESVVPESTMEK